MVFRHRRVMPATPKLVLKIESTMAAGRTFPMVLEIPPALKSNIAAWTHVLMSKVAKVSLNVFQKVLHANVQSLQAHVAFFAPLGFLVA